MAKNYLKQPIISHFHSADLQLAAGSPQSLLPIMYRSNTHDAATDDIMILIRTMAANGFNDVTV